MRRNLFVAAIVIALLTCASSVWSSEHEKYHHDLRGLIVKVAPAKNEFTIQTNEGEVAVCLVDAKTVIKRGEKRIRLNDVRAGERAYCHCAVMKNGKQYSEQVLLEKSKDE